MNNKELRKISGTKSYQAANRTYYWQNKNKFLTRYYKYCTGGKTGFTKKSGRTLVTTAEKDEMELVAVTLNAPDDWNDHTTLYDWGFENHSKQQSNLTEVKEEKITNAGNLLTDAIGLYRKLIGLDFND